MTIPKHIVLVGNTAWGMYNFRKDLIQFLIGEGYRITVIAPFDKDYSDKIRNIGCVFISINIDNKGINIFKDLRLLSNFCRIYYQLKPDFIFHYTIKPVIYGSLASRLLRIPQIPIITGLGSAFLAKNFVTKIVIGLYRISLKSAQKVWFLNKDDMNLFIKLRIVRTGQCQILNGEGINTEFFRPTGNYPLNKSFILAARLLWDKGVKEFVEAAKIVKTKFPDVQFNILGFIGVDNPSAIRMQDISEWQNANTINYLGSTDNVIPYISSSTCVVLPSYREGLSRILLEAASMGKPIIATNITGCKEIVEDGITGYLCEVKDVKSLAEKMETLLSLSDDEIRMMGEKARRKVLQEFDQKTVNSIYKEMLVTHMKNTT